jgi:hypothetical protein
VEERGVNPIIVVIAIVVIIAAAAAIGGYYLAHEKSASIIKIAIDGLENNGLFETEPYAHLLENTAPADPIYVESIDNSPSKFPNYYLVPFVRNGRTWVVAMVDAELGTFMGATCSENGEDKYPTVSREEAFEIVRKAIEYIGPLQNAKLVWKMCEPLWAPYYPFWAVQADGKTVYVAQDGQLYEELKEKTVMG